MSRFKVNSMIAVFLLTGFLFQGELTAQCFRKCSCRQQQCCPQPCCQTNQCCQCQNCCRSAAGGCASHLADDHCGCMIAANAINPKCVTPQDKADLINLASGLNLSDPQGYDTFRRRFEINRGRWCSNPWGYSDFLIPDPCETCCAGRLDYDECVGKCYDRTGPCAVYGRPPTRCPYPCAPRCCPPICQPHRGCLPRLRLFRRCR